MKTIFTAAISLFLLTACGGDNKAVEPKTPEEQPSNENATPGSADITINVTGNSMADMAYSPTSVTVHAGDKVKITLVNKNTEASMFHNWVLVKLGTGADIATAGMKAGAEKNYVPESPGVFAATPLAGPTQTVTVEFTAPEKGSYNYICTYPGHFPKMLGKMIVK